MSGDRIEVVGSGTAEVRPDLFVAQLAAEATGPDVATALEAAELASHAMAETARTRGGAGDADLRTADMSVTTNHDHHGQPDGYRAWLALTVTLRDLAAAGGVLAEVLAAGGDATRLTGVTLVTSDPGAALDLARGRAMADARHQAEQLAVLAGRSLGGVRRVSAVPSVGGWPRPGGFQEQSGRAVSLSVEGGTSTVAVSVEVRFDLV